MTGWEKNGRVVNGMKIDLKPTTNMKTNLTEKTISALYRRHYMMDYFRKKKGNRKIWKDQL